MIVTGPRPVAVLDTCILFPNSLRDTLFRATLAGLYRAHLSDDILTELERNLVRRGAVPTQEHAEHLIGAIRKSLAHTIVTDYEALIPGLTCDPKDRHVLAAAIKADAETIVTKNERDFPAASLAPYDIVTEPPDDFLLFLYDRDPTSMVQVIRDQSEGLKRLPKTVPEVLQTLHQHTPRFVAAMYTDMWTSGDLPLDRHTRDLYSRLRQSGASIPKMDPQLEQELWAKGE